MAIEAIRAEYAGLKAGLDALGKLPFAREASAQRLGVGESMRRSFEDLLKLGTDLFSVLDTHQTRWGGAVCPIPAILPSRDVCSKLDDRAT